MENARYLGWGIEISSPEKIEEAWLEDGCGALIKRKLFEMVQS
jgi:hypothetical protein